MTLQSENQRTKRCSDAPAAYRYQVNAWRTADGAGLAKCELAPNALHFAAPPEFGGLQGRWTPETLLMGAIAGCFTTTFQIIAEHSSLAYTDLEVEVEGVVAKVESGYELTELRIRPLLVVAEAKDHDRALELLWKVQTLCLVSRALSVEQRFEPRVETKEMTPVG